MFILCCTLRVCLCMCMLCKSENLFFKPVLSSRRENTGPVTRDHVKSPKRGTKHL